jgi:aconitate hydratase
MSETSNSRTTLKVGAKEYTIHSLQGLPADKLARLPFSLKILLENLLRFQDGVNVTNGDVNALLDWDANAAPSHEIAFTPARVIMQDFTGVPCVVDLAAMRDAVVKLGGDATRVNPLAPAELVIDHSVQVDAYGSAHSLADNVNIEYARNGERYAFLRWGQTAFNNFKVVPPNTGIVHQVNVEHLARVVFADANGNAYPDTLVGTDSHTTMVNGLGVLGWGVGGIEAEAAMLGQPVTMLIPHVIGFRMKGTLPAGTTATDLVLTITEMLRKKGVVDKFVEFFGDGLKGLPLADRSTIANMAPEFGSTCGIFPIDEETLKYLALTGRSQEQIDLVEAYAKHQGMWRIDGAPAANYTDVLELDLGTVVPSLAGPKRPQDRVLLTNAKNVYRSALEKMSAERTQKNPTATGSGTANVDGASFEVKDGAVLIAAITSCTNTSNPTVLVAAGLLAKKAAAKGLKAQPWVKTSLAPGSRVVTDYLTKAGLLSELEKVGFFTVGYGCTTCIGNSGPLKPEISEAVKTGDVVATSVLSGNRNFEGRVHAEIKMNFLASPPLVVAYALAGTLDKDITTEPLGTGERWPAGLPEGRLAEPGGSGRCRRWLRRLRHVQEELLERVRGRCRLERHCRGRRQQLRLGRQEHVRAQPSLLRRHDHDAEGCRRNSGRSRAGRAWRLRHHRPHLPGWQYLQELPSSTLPAVAGRGTSGLQLVRRSSRQPRSDDARHFRQHPSAQPAGAGHGRWRVGAHPVGRANVHLRRRREVPGGRHPARHPGRQGIRHGFFP